MAAKFKLVPNPTFTIPVMIPRAGEEDGELKVTFKHMKQEQLKAMQERFAEEITEIIEKSNNETAASGLEVLQQPIMVKFLMEIASGWELSDEWSEDNLMMLISSFPRAFDAITVAYQNELWCLRKKP